MSLLLITAHGATLTDEHSSTGERHVIHSVSDVSSLVIHHTDNRSHASIIITIALGGMFLDAYDLGALAFGIKDMVRKFNLTPAGDTGMVASASMADISHYIWRYRRRVLSTGICPIKLAAIEYS